MSTVNILKNLDVNKEVYRKYTSLGMKIYVIPDKNKKSVNMNLVVKYGGKDRMYKDRLSGEIKLLPEGTAHFIEHLTFNQKNLKYDEIFRIFEKLDCEVNAHTSLDNTCYEVDIYGKDYINPLRKLLAMVFKPYYTKECIEKELGIIFSEIEISRKFTSIYNVIFENSFESSSIIGSKESVSTITEDMINNVYENYYTPNNMALIVSGNVSPGEIFFQVEKILKKIQVKYKPKVERMYLKEEEPKQKTMKGNYTRIKDPYVQLGFKLPDVDKKEKTKLKIVSELFEILHISNASEFAENLRKNKIIKSKINLEYIQSKNIYVISTKTKSPFKFKKLLVDYLESLVNCEVSEEDFEMAKKALYGRNIRRYNKVFDSIILNNFLEGETPFSEIDLLFTMSIESYKNYLNVFLGNLDKVYMYYQR